MRNEKIKILFCYIITVAILYYPVVFMGRSLIPSLYYPSPVMDLNDLKMRKVLYGTFLVDLPTPVYYEEPTNKIVGDMIKNGKVPLWDPYTGLGVPLAAQYSSRAFFPYQILENISPYFLWDYFILFRLVIAGFFTYLFLRRLNINILPAFITGVIYQFSGSFTWFINLEQLVNVGMLVPVFLFTIQRLLQKNTIKNQFILSFVIAMVLYAGQPETALYVLTLGFLYTGFGLWQRSGETGIEKCILGHVLSWLIGFMFASPLLLPFLELAFDSHHLHFFKEKLGLQHLSGFTYLLHILLPGVSVDSGYCLLFPCAMVWDFTGSYVSIAVWILIFATIFKKNILYKKELIFFVVCGFIILFQRLGIPPFRYIGNLLLFDLVFVPRWTSPVWSLCFALGAGLCLHNISVISLKDILVSLLIFILLFISLNIYLSTTIFDVICGYPLYKYSYLQSIIVFLFFIFMLLLIFKKINDVKTRLVSILLLILFELWFYIPKGYEMKWNYILFIPLILGWSTLFIIENRKKQLFLILSAILSYIIIELISPTGLPLRRDPFPILASINKIKELGYSRIVGLDRRFMPNYAGAYQLFDVRYINALSPIEYHNFANYNLLSKPLTKYNILWFIGVSDSDVSFYEDFIKRKNIYSWLGVKYVFSSPYYKFDLPLIYKDPYTIIYENKEYHPRTYIVFDTEKANNIYEAQLKINNDFDFRNKAIVEKNIKIKPDDKKERRWEANILKYEPNTIEIETFSSIDGLLVLTDSYYKGWKVFVDGKENELLRVNGLVRGVVVAAGRHNVIFRYMPLTFKAGCGLLFVGLLFYTGCSLTYREKKWQGARNGTN
ncbi:MAG: YfhO family protein [Candidatus Hydrogenedentota bacterium]